MARKTVSRRDFLKVVGAVSGAAVLASCTPATPMVEDEQPEATQASEATAVPEEQPAEEQPAEEPVGPELEGKVVVYFGDWTPTESMERSEDNPAPHNKILEVVDEYTGMYPGVEIEWLELPEGITREWTVAQQMAGTIPHVMPASAWVIKEDLDKDWWVNLTPYLNEANPYIPSGDAGSEAWMDQFYPTPTSMLVQTGGTFYNVCFGIVTTWFFYNVDMFDELGIQAPETYYDFLENCKVADDAGLIGYDGQTYDTSDTDFWYKQQLGSMIMARDLEPLVNPDGGFATFDEVACALENDVYNANLPQFRQWMELWKMNVPYRRADWTVIPQDALALFLRKETPVSENGSWVIPRLETDPLLDFEWATFWAPTLTTKMSEYVTDPPATAPNVGTVSNSYAVTTRAEKDGVLDVAIDLVRFMSVPENVGKVQGEIGTDMPNVKNVTVPDRFTQAHKWLVESMGYVTMFQYPSCTMDLECTQRTEKAWWAYLLDEMTIDEAIEENDAAFKEYADRYLADTGLQC